MRKRTSIQKDVSLRGRRKALAEKSNEKSRSRREQRREDDEKSRKSNKY